MLTTEGKLHIKRYLAGYVPTIASAVAFGIGNNGETLTDASLQLEAGRNAIDLTSYDFANNDLIFKAPVPDDYVGKIYEIAIYSLIADSNEFASRIISTFDSETENWVNPVDGSSSTFGTVANRIGIDALRHNPSASATTTSSLKDVALDLSGYSGSDAFTFAFNCIDANANQIVFRFLTDSANYYSFNMGTQTSGYKITSVTKSSAVVTGSPNWNNITEIQVLTTAKSAGATAVEYDAIRLEDKDSDNIDYLLVARKVLVSPITKVAGQPMDIEYALDVSI